MLRYLISLPVRLSLLFYFYQTYSFILVYLFDLSCNPAWLNWNKLLLIQLNYFKPDFVVDLADIFITQLLPSLHFLFINRYPLILFMLVEIFLYYFVTKSRRKFYIDFWFRIWNCRRRCYLRFAYFCFLMRLHCRLRPFLGMILLWRLGFRWRIPIYHSLLSIIDKRITCLLSLLLNNCFSLVRQIRFDRTFNNSWIGLFIVSQGRQLFVRLRWRWRTWWTFGNWSYFFYIFCFLFHISINL